MDGVRKRMRRFEGDRRVRYLTFSTYRRLPLFENDLIKDRFAEQLAAVRGRGGFRLFAWVVMPEHVHLVVWPGEQDVTPILAGLKGKFARDVLQRWRALDAPVLARLVDDSGAVRFWQRGGGYDRNVRDRGELMEKIRYVHLNPVRRGLVERPEDWAWSSARWYDGERDGVVSIDAMDW